MIRKLRSGWSDLKRSPRVFLRYLAGSLDCLVVFSAEIGAMPPAAPVDGLKLRKLTDAEAADLPGAGGQLRAETAARLRSFGFNGAWGGFVGEQLAHVSWTVVGEQDRLMKPPMLGLRADEAEITACYTAPEFRGKSIYPFAIHVISRQLARQGVRRVFMKTTPRNAASQRGIQKAGLRRCGPVYRYWLPWLPGWTGLLIRPFRWRRAAG